MSGQVIVPFPGKPVEYVQIGNVWVDPRLWTTRFDCDVMLQGCHSMCCYRSNILAPGEKEKIRQHIDGILPYMTERKKKVYLERGDFEADCNEQCPSGCELNEDEVNAMSRAFSLDQDYRCNLIVRKSAEEDMDSCIFLAKNSAGENHCSIHAYAVDHGINWMSIKPADCIQYPIAIYQERGRTILGIQTTANLSHLPCHHSGLGPSLYRSMEGTIRYLLGDEFYSSLESFISEKALV